MSLSKFVIVYRLKTESAFSGASDWLDGFVARRYNQGSVIGSYLDPLADKVLICCTAAALAHEVWIFPLSLDIWRLPKSICFIGTVACSPSILIVNFSSEH